MCKTYNRRQRLEIWREQRQSIKIQFAQPRVRQQFVKKVLSLVLMQLIIIFSPCIIVFLSEELQKWLFDWLLLIFLFCFINVAMLVIGYSCTDFIRKFPRNYIYLFIYTFNMAAFMSFMAAYYGPELFTKAGVATAGIVFVVALIAWFAPIDFTKYIPYLCVITLNLSVFSFIYFFFPSKQMNNIYCGGGILVFSVWLIIDLQLMIGGRHAMSFGPDDYCLAAVFITSDVIILYRYVIQSQRDNN